MPACNVGVPFAGSGSERECTRRLERLLGSTDDASRVTLSELVTSETAAERVAARRR